MFTVCLTEPEIMFCRLIAGLRTLTNRIANVKDTKMGSLSGLQADEDGLLGEYSFCKKMNVFADLVPVLRSGSFDCVLMGEKST